MSTVSPEMPVAGERESIADDLIGMGSFYIDPAGAAKRVFRNWFWVGPLILFSIVSVIASRMMLPMIQHVFEVMPIPEGVNPNQYQRGLDMGLTFQRIAMYFAPITTAIILSIQAVVIFGMCQVLGVTAKFKWIFNLVAGCLLIQMLASIASLIILKVKGEVSTMAELRPALGLDIFLPEGTNKFLTALLGYFSVFEIWWIVMAVLVFSAAFRVSKAKGLAAVLPLVFLSIVFRVCAAALQRT